MRVIRRPTAFAAVSELRTGMDAILAQLKETPVSLEKHGKPVAVLVDPERFAAMERALEEVSDRRLADEARRRALKLKGRGVPLAEIERRFR
ncbi:MAG TPA: type II toxin-antitoxin system Phd/YefM family antitoxin [Elusimicrobiota bacterium]|jgi:PHD/YefM family antitoxin component YafN of YafNO toxin-antitoxin module|nr:type II toxin-antitoxin system Phd/YefM family antitoxin [Elusimicrobiota bacterium]